MGGEYALALAGAAVGRPAPDDRARPQRPRRTDDPLDFAGQRLGLFASGEQRAGGCSTTIAWSWRCSTATTATTTAATRDVRGWALLSELGKRFDDSPWRPRLYLHGGLTDEPDGTATAFRLNAIQSDRVADPRPTAPAWSAPSSASTCATWRSTASAWTASPGRASSSTCA